MAGLLDGLFATPSDQALWALGSGLLGVRRGDEGRAMMNSLKAYHFAQEGQRRNELTDMQRQMAEFQLTNAKRQRDEQEKEDAFYTPENLMSPAVPYGTGMTGSLDEQDVNPGRPASVLPSHVVAQKMLTSGSRGLAKQGFAALQKEVRPPVVVGEGAALVDPVTGKPLYERGKTQQPPEIVRLAAMRDSLPQGHPMRAVLDDAIRKQTTHAPAASATVINRQESAEAKTVGEFWGKQYGKIQEDGFAASSKMARLDRMSSLLDGVETGKLTPTGTEIAAYLKSVGIDVDPKLDNKQAAQALSRELAMQARNPSGGAGMPGAMSDADREFLVSTVPGLANTPGGNRLMIETSRRLAKRDAEVARLATQYRLKKGQLDEGFVEELRQFAEANPLFADIATAGGGDGVMRFDRTGRRVR